MNYSDIDPILLPWAATRSLQVATSFKDEETRTIIVVDDSGDTYYLYAGPNPKDSNYPNSALATVGVSLSKRGEKKYHAFYRERIRFTFEQTVSLDQISSALDAAWKKLHNWIAEAGHTRTAT